jgi:hypothetical protein
MKLRYATAMVLVAILSVVAGSAPASAAAAGPPVVLLLKPATSTYVPAGGKVTVQYNFKYVMARPYVTLYFRKDYGPRQPVNLSMYTDYLTVPATWKPGTYRLDSVAAEDTDRSKGEHFRNYLYVGTDGNGNVVKRTYTHLNIAVMDIHVQN